LADPKVIDPRCGPSATSRTRSRDAPPLDCRTGHNAPAMSMLFSADDKASAAGKFLMQ
jgi:hypothetical protein